MADIPGARSARQDDLLPLCGKDGDLRLLSSRLRVLVYQEAVRAWLVTDRAFRAPERLVSPAGGCRGKQEEGNNPSRAYPGGGRTWETSLGSAGSFFSLRRCGVAKAYQYGSENVIGPVQRVFVESAPLPISPYASVPRSGMLRR